MPVFAIVHSFQNHEDTQSGLGPLDDGLRAHVLHAARRMDTYVWIMGDHGVRYGSLRQSEAGLLEERNPALWVLAPLEHETPARLLTMFENQRRLVSMYDVHVTLAQLACMSARQADEPMVACAGLKRRAAPGRDLFEESLRGDRSCAGAGIPAAYCATDARPCETDGAWLRSAMPPILSAFEAYANSKLGSFGGRFYEVCEPLGPEGYTLVRASSPRSWRPAQREYSVVLARQAANETGFFVEVVEDQSSQRWTVTHASRSSAYDGELCHDGAAVPLPLRTFCFCR